MVSKKGLDIENGKVAVDISTGLIIILAIDFCHFTDLKEELV